MTNYSFLIRYVLVAIAGFCSTLLVAQDATLKWEYALPANLSFGSPKCVDLNGDEVLDIVLGYGMDGKIEVASGVIAINGATGEELWQMGMPGMDQIFSQPQFIDVNTDDTPDVLIGGRKGQYFALDGNNGNMIWSFDFNAFFPEAEVPMNLYSAQNIGDIDNDGISDALNAIGGTGEDDFRYPGRLLVFSGADGTIIQSDTVPDLQETYCSPLVADFGQGQGVNIIFGTGGETLGGKLWKVALEEFLDNGLDAAIPLAQNSDKGFTATPSLADFNGDNVLDVCIPGMDGTLRLVNGASNSLMWIIDKPGYEVYNSPSVGYLNTDSTPDVACIFHHGIFPAYDHSLLLLIDGETGDIIQEDTLTGFFFFSDALADLDGDGIDEIISTRNGNSLELGYFNLATSTWTSFSTVAGAMNISNTPFVGDLDGNGMTDIVYCYFTDNLVCQRFELSVDAPPSWAGYLGNLGDGVFGEHFTLGGILLENENLGTIQAFAVDAVLHWQLEGDVPATKGNLYVFDYDGKMLYFANNEQKEGCVQLAHLPKGRPYCLLYEYEGGVAVGKFFHR